jgi:signal transduction histidine kinase
LVVLIIHAVLLPLLFFGLLIIVERSHADIFVNQVRTYGRLLADELELGDVLSSPDRTLELLDSIILSGQGVYAEVAVGERSLRSNLVAPAIDRFPGDDFEFGEHSDHTYFLSVPVTRAGQRVDLRLGFDETATWEQIQLARNQILAALLAFTLVSVALAIWLATRIAQPMIRLQNAARRIATGHFDSHLETGSKIHEVQDLTDHLESMRSELVGINARLSKEMVERAAAEAQRQSLEEKLRHRERIATVGTLAGGIAHEFNNILTPILLYTQTALEEIPASSPSASDLRRVIAAANRARSLVTRILTFSRQMESGEKSLVRLGPIIEEVLALLRAIVPPNVEIVSELSSDVPAVLGDVSLIHQLAMNLCTNAYQAMRATEGRLTVAFTRRLERFDERLPPGDYVELTIADTGHGMDAKTKARIFEPFFTTREVGEGTGLGLSVALGIATSMNASILVDSELGAGTTFRVCFPVPAAAGEGASEADASPSGAASVGGS